MTRTYEGLTRDVRYALRGFRKQPAFATSAIATIAVGTTALASVLSIAYAALGRGLPYPGAERLVQIEQVTTGVGRVEVAPVDVLALREGCPSLERLTIAWFSSSSVAGGTFPERARQVLTDSHAFAMLGVAPLHGRLPGPGDDAPGARVVVIGHGLWASRFGSDPAVVGRVVRVDGEPHTVIAVMPRGFAFPAPYWAAGDLWLMRGPSHPRWPDLHDRVLLAFGLLRDGRTLSDAQHEAEAVAASLQRERPRAAGSVGLRITAWGARERDDARRPLALLLAAAAMVFVIVCVNVLNLLVGRVLDRRRELATRAALGAGRARMVQPLAIEAGVLFAAGGIAGIATAAVASRVLASSGVLTVPRAHEATVDTTVVVIALGTVLAAALVVALVLAPQVVAVGPGAGRDAARGASEGRGLRRLRLSLVAIQIGLAFVLLCGSGVLLEGAIALARVSPGFEARGLLIARISLPPAKYPTPDQQAAFHQRVIESLRAVPGVLGAAAVDVLPATGGAGGPAVLLEGDPLPASPRELRHADIRVISAGYFETLGVRPRTGRSFVASDARGAPVAIVNESFAATYLRGQPAGQRLRVTLRGTRELDPPPRTVVGVVADLKEETIYRPAPPTVYVPIGQAPTIRMAFVLRSARRLDGATAIRDAVAAADPDLAAFAFDTLEAAIARELSFNRFNLLLIGALSSASLFLAVIGVYGVMAHAVRHRAREIGIRVALGLTPGGVRRRVMGEGAWLAAAGIALGLAGAFWGAGVLRSVVHGIDRTSTVTFVAAAVVLALAVLAGSYIPARRASRLEPARVLAAE
jgi:predicted permease